MLFHGRGMDIVRLLSALLLTISRNHSKYDDNLTYKSEAKRGKSVFFFES